MLSARPTVISTQSSCCATARTKLFIQTGDIAEKVAVRFSANQVFDYVELGNNFSIYEIAPLPEWIGHSIRDVNVRVKYNANIIGIKAENGMELMPNAEYVFRREEHLMIIGHQRDMEKILKKL